MYRAWGVVVDEGHDPYIRIVQNSLDNRNTLYPPASARVQGKQVGEYMYVSVGYGDGYHFPGLWGTGV